MAIQLVCCNSTDAQLHHYSAPRCSSVVQVQASYRHPGDHVSPSPTPQEDTEPALTARMGWSIPTILFPLVKSPAGFALARFAVGFAEGPFFACVALMTSSWYVREELPFRMALWHGAQCMSYVQISHERGPLSRCSPAVTSSEDPLLLSCLRPCECYILAMPSSQEGTMRNEERGQLRNEARSLRNTTGNDGGGDFATLQRLEFVFCNRLEDGRELTSREGIRGMRAWQWFMLIEGALSIAIAIAAGFVLPNWGEFDPP